MFFTLIRRADALGRSPYLAVLKVRLDFQLHQGGNLLPAGGIAIKAKYSVSVPSGPFLLPFERI